MIDEFKYTKVNEDGSYDELSVLRKCKFAIGHYKYTCVLHYIIKHMLEIYIDHLKHSKDIYSAIIVDNAIHILNNIHRSSKWRSFINYYYNWLMKPRFNNAGTNEASVNMEFHTFQDAISHECITSDITIRYHEEGYWLMFNHTDELAISIVNKNIKCKYDSELPYEKFIKNKLDMIIGGLRDRYIISQIGLIESKPNMIAVHLIPGGPLRIKKEAIENSTITRRYVHSIEVIDRNDDDKYIVGVERRHFEYISVYRLVNGTNVIRMKDGSKIPYLIFIDLVDSVNGSCFAIVDDKDLPTDPEMRSRITERIACNLCECIEDS
jgi:hypothetical protein